jgi:hypothetical protein
MRGSMPQGVEGFCRGYAPGQAAWSPLWMAAAGLPATHLDAPSADLRPNPGWASSLCVCVHVWNGINPETIGFAAPLVGRIGNPSYVCPHRRPELPVKGQRTPGFRTCDFSPRFGRGFCQRTGIYHFLAKPFWAGRKSLGGRVQGGRRVLPRKLTFGKTLVVWPTTVVRAPSSVDGQTAK